MDVHLNTEHNLNKFQGLKWGDALRMGNDIHGEAAGTYGLAAGFARRRRTAGAGAGLRDQAEREAQIADDLGTFYDAAKAGKVLRTQTLGGQIPRGDGVWKPRYFVGALRDGEVHLSAVSGVVQLRPQFHHLDAEDLRERVAGTREFATSAAVGDGGVDGAGTAEAGAEPATRVVRQSYKMANPKGELESCEKQLRQALQSAAEEPWTELRFVDGGDEEAFKVFGERLFVRDVQGAVALRSAWSGEEFLDAVSAPSAGGARKRRRVGRKKGGVDVGEDGEEEEVGEVDGD